MIYIRNKGVVIELEGKIKRLPSLRGYNSIETVHGVLKTERTRGVVNISIDIMYINDEEYRKLETLFLTNNNKVDIEDVDKGVYYTNYFIQGDSLNLEEKEDLSVYGYYYTGNLQLNKV